MASKKGLPPQLHQTDMSSMKGGGFFLRKGLKGEE